jgi:S1-C subfamily serine protease
MTVKLHQVFWLGLWLTMAAIPIGLPAALTPEKLYQKVLPSVMTLEVENQSGERFVGSAVLALADDVAVTTWHVVADARSVWAIFADGQRVKVIGCIDHDQVRDLALLKLEKHLSHRQATVSRELQSVAARAYVIGSPKGYDFSISDGLISQIRSVDGFLQYQLSCPISPGNSGSPILNQRGEVIGIAAWTKTDAQNLNFAIPTREFTRLNVSAQLTTWEQLAVAARQNSPPTAVKLRQIVEPGPAEETSAGSYAAFKKQLNASAGKPVTVVVQEAGRTKTFKFIMK